MWLEFQSRGVPFDQSLRERATRRLSFALDRFESRLGRILVSLKDENGPRGGVDAHCRIVAELRPGGRLVVEDLAANPGLALTRAIGRLHRSVGRTLDRRRKH